MTADERRWGRKARAMTDEQLIETLERWAMMGGNSDASRALAREVHRRKTAA